MQGGRRRKEEKKSYMWIAWIYYLQTGVFLYIRGKRERDVMGDM